MTFAEYIAVTKDVLVGLFAASAAVFAYLGISEWRKELKGKAEYQLAKDVLKSVYKVREAFKHVRCPIIYQYEYPEEMRSSDGHLEGKHDYEGNMYVYQKRWEVMEVSFKELEEHHLAAQVEWGPEFQNVIIKLRACRVELMTAIQRMLARKKNPRNGALTSVEERTEERSVLEEIGSDSKPDEFTSQINEAINEFEKWLRPHIKTSS